MEHDELIGKHFGQLTVVRLADDHERRTGPHWSTRKQFMCQCDCGNTHITSSFNLNSKRTISCGCYKISGKGRITHGQRRIGNSGSRAYVAWLNMKERCDNSNKPQYKDWGGRGITYCDRWKDFNNFYLDMGDPPVSKSLDRINNDLGYEPGNCRWATRSEQRNNQNETTLHFIEWNGVRKTIREWELELGFKKGVLRCRIWRGNPICESTMTPPPETAVKVRR